MRSVRAWVGAWSLAAVALAGCGGTTIRSAQPSRTWRGPTTPPCSPRPTRSAPFNLLSLGATVHVVLNPDGTTTGHLFVPDLGQEDGELDADLTGTWTLSGSTVTFSQTADTFIRDVEFTASQNSLESEGTFEGTTLHLALAKTG